MPRALLLATSIAVGVTVLAGATVQPAAAGPPIPRIESARGFDLAARCPPGFRRHTITAKCVRRQPRFPLLGWL